MPFAPGGCPLCFWCCAPARALTVVRVREVEWVWRDVIDANSWVEIQKKTSNLLSKILEAGWDVVGDKLMDTEFNVKVRWTDRGAEEMQVPPPVGGQ